MSELLDACREAHERLIATASKIDDAIARRPSRLPGWSVGHVLTHIARNADGYVRRVEGALRGEDLGRYAGGKAERDKGIEEGAGRPAAELLADVTESARRLDEVFAEAERAGWPNDEFLGRDEWPVSQSPLYRMREVEVHQVDLGVGYEPSDWSDLYVGWELGRQLDTLPGRLSGPDQRQLLAWLMGRAGQPDLRVSDWGY